MAPALGLIRVARSPQDGLTDLVRRRLSWPSEIAVDRELHELIRHVDVLPHEVERVIRVPDTGAVEARLAQVHADVEHHACRTHPLSVEHAESIGGVVEIA